MSISGREDEHQREAQPSGHQAGGQSPGPRRPAQANARADEQQAELQRAISWPQMSIERERESAKKSGSEMKAVSEKLSLLSLFVVL